MKNILPALALLFALSIWSCKEDNNSTANTESTKSTDIAINIAKKRDPRRLHPFVYPSPSARDVYQYIFPQLADFNPKSLQLEPVLIKSIPEEVAITEGPHKGGIQFTMEILPEAKWDDGSEVTAYDYAFGVKAVMNHLSQTKGYRSHLKFISDIVIDQDNPKKFTVVFDKHYLLAKETALTIELYPEYIYDPKKLHRNVSLQDISNVDYVNNLVAKDSTLANWAKDFNGLKHTREVVNSCGPYKLKEWVTDEYVILERKENYWAKNSNSPFLKAGPKEIVFHLLADEASILAQLKDGSLDMATGVTGSAFEELKNNNSNLQFFTPQLLKYYMLAINNDQPELSDKNVRQAIAHVLDVDNIMNSIDYGNGTRTTGPIHPSKAYYDKSLTPRKYDIEKAKKLLADAGWSDSNNDGTIDKKINGKSEELVLDIHVTEGKLGQQIALLLQEGMAKVQGKVNIIQKTFKKIKAENLNTRKYDLTPMIVSQDLVNDDPYTRWHSDQDTPKGRNIYGYGNDRLDKITKDLQVIEDPAKRDALYKEVQQILYEDQPVIFLYAPNERIVVNNKWKANGTMRRPGYLANTFTLK